MKSSGARSLRYARNGMEKREWVSLKNDRLIPMDSNALAEAVPSCAGVASIIRWGLAL
jgi:hypothetical protein